MKAMSKKDQVLAEKEASLLAQLHHPNIVAFLESFLCHNGQMLCIVMEFADGGDLEQLLKKRRGKLLPEAQVFALFIQVSHTAAMSLCCVSLAT